MKFLILSLLLVLNYNFNIEQKQTDEEVFNSIIELEKLLIIHNKSISDYKKIEPKECEFPILTKEDIFNFYKNNNTKVKIFYKIESWYVMVIIEKNNFSYIILMN